jgi:thiamine biosynthesis protein ThiS
MTDDARTVAITVNGDPRSAPVGSSVEDLLASFGLHPRMVVVEHNRTILDRARYASVVVSEGDTFELVHFVGGGR